MADNIYGFLVTTALYALNSKSRDLIFEAYGQVKMAQRLKAITQSEFMELSRMLVRDGINNQQMGLS